MDDDICNNAILLKNRFLVQNNFDDDNNNNNNQSSDDTSSKTPTLDEFEGIVAAISQRLGVNSKLQFQLEVAEDLAKQMAIIKKTYNMTPSAFFQKYNALNKKKSQLFNIIKAGLLSIAIPTLKNCSPHDSSDNLCFTDVYSYYVELTSLFLYPEVTFGTLGTMRIPPGLQQKGHPQQLRELHESRHKKVSRFWFRDCQFRAI